MEQILDIAMFPVELLGVKTYLTKSARNLGVVFDKTLNFRSHISAICSSCIYHIRDLRRVCCQLDLDSAKLLANVPVFTCLNYCNSLLSGNADTDLQCIANCLGMQILTSNVLHTVWLVRSQNHQHLLTVLYCCVLFIGYQWNI